MYTYVTVIYPEMSVMSLSLLMFLKSTYSVPRCLIHAMFCTAYYHQKRLLVIICGNVPTTLPSIKDSNVLRKNFMYGMPFIDEYGIRGR